MMVLEIETEDGTSSIEYETLSTAVKDMKRSVSLKQRERSNMTKCCRCVIRQQPINRKVVNIKVDG